MRRSASTAPGSPAPALLGSELGEAIQIAENILHSGFSYAQALWYSIMHFDRALKDAQRIPPFEQEVGGLKKALELSQEDQIEVACDAPLPDSYSAPSR